MKYRVLIGLAVFAMASPAPAMAGPGDADLWAVTENGVDGLLIDEETGDAWLTGSCLKLVSAVIKTGNVWTSRTVELVSVGRSSMVLDQTFTLDTGKPVPVLTVTSVHRGGPQDFPVRIEPDCQSSTACRALLDAPAC